MKTSLNFASLSSARWLGIASTVLLFALALIVPRAAYGQSRYTLKISNNSKVDVYQIFMSSAEKKSWGQDFLSGVILAAGDKITIIRIVPGEWDIKFVDEGGHECVLRGVKIFENLNWSLTTDWLQQCEGFKPHVQGSPVSWVPPKAVIPTNAIRGGSEENGNPIYVCRASYSGGTHPGKVVGLNCNIGFAGREIHLPNYELLVGSGTWGVPRAGYPGALVAGGENGRQLYLCRAAYHGGVHPGKIVEDQCNIAFGGVEIKVPNFEVFYPR